MFEQFPYVNFHDLNLDWIISEIKKCYSPDNPPEAVVLSVNGETGNVILYKNAVVHFPDVEDGTWNIFRKGDGQETGIQFIKNQPAQRIAGVNRYNIYDAGNPPPYPVTSVDGNTGSVTTWANTGNADVVLPHEAEGDIWSLARECISGNLGIQFELDDNDDPCGYFILHPEGESLQKIKILTEEDIPASAGVITINGEYGVVVLTASDIKMDTDDNTTIKAKIEATQDITAPEYDTSTSYTAGDYCVYLDTLYKCTGSTTGAFNPAKWTATKVGEELETLVDGYTFLDGVKADNEIVAYTETGTTSSDNYSAGTYLVINGSLYKAKTNISSGDQFTGTNVAAVDNVGHELSSMQKVLKDTSVSGVTCWKQGNVVTVNVAINHVTTTTLWETIATIPSAFRPSMELAGWYDTNSQSRIIINNLGRIEAGSVLTDVSLRFTACYIVE